MAKVQGTLCVIIIIIINKYLLKYHLVCRDEDVLAAGAEPPRVAARRGVVDQAAAVLRVALRHRRGLLVPGLKIFACHCSLVSVSPLRRVTMRSMSAAGGVTAARSVLCVRTICFLVLRLCRGRSRAVGSRASRGGNLGTGRGAGLADI